jgi:hypothetical protein
MAEKRQRRRGAGRPPSAEPATVRKNILFKPSEWQQLVASLPADIRIGTYLHDIAMKAAAHELVDPALAGIDSFSARFLTQAPCGPWQEAIEQAVAFELSNDVAEELEARDGDVIVRAVGQSMEGAGIFDGALVLMRPLLGHRQPRAGEIALVQRIDVDGNCEGMIKRWHGGEPPVLKDGASDVIEIPAGTRQILPVAVARGVISRL